MDGAHPLSQSWRAKANLIREEIFNNQMAKVFELHALQLDEWWHNHLNQELTIAEAAVESGYSASHLYHSIRDCELPNAGQKGRPRIRRCDLPRRPGKQAPDLIPTERLAILNDLELTSQNDS